MVLPIEQRDVAIELSKPVTVTMTNLLNLTHITLIAMLTIRSNQITGGKGGSFEPIVDHAALAEILGPLSSQGRLRSPIHWSAKRLS